MMKNVAMICNVLCDCGQMWKKMQCVAIEVRCSVKCTVYCDVECGCGVQSLWMRDVDCGGYAMSNMLCFEM